jgi:hypothetical protein
MDDGRDILGLGEGVLISGPLVLFSTCLVPQAGESKRCHKLKAMLGSIKWKHS